MMKEASCFFRGKLQRDGTQAVLEQQGMAKASDSMGESNRATCSFMLLKLQHDLFFFPSLPALWGFFPSDPSNI